MKTYTLIVKQIKKLLLKLQLSSFSIFSNHIRYLIKQRLSPKDYLSSVRLGKFPSSKRSLLKFPDIFSLLILLLLLILFFSATDITLKQFLLRNFHFNIDGVGNLGNLSAAILGVLATVISVGLATLGIILQTLAQEQNVFKRKFLLYHFFDRQQIANKIAYSMGALIFSGFILVFKEKLIFYPLLSEHIYFVFLLTTIVVLLFTYLITKSFYYLFPEKQDEFFGQELNDHISKLIYKAGQSLLLVDYLEQQLLPEGIGIRYIYDEKEKRNSNLAIIETREKGSIDDVDISLLKQISKLLGDNFIEQQRDKKNIKAEIYIEYGKPENRTYQPLARVSRKVYNSKIDRLFKNAIILSTKTQYNLDEQLTSYLEWVWDSVRIDLQDEKITSEQSNLRRVYDFFENALRIFSEYKKKYGIKDNSVIDKWEHFNNLRSQYYAVLESAYQDVKVISPILYLNYAPYALMERAVYIGNITQFVIMSELTELVYRKIVELHHSRKSIILEHFLLNNRQFGEFHLLGSSEKFKEKFKNHKDYIDAYLTAQINLIHRAICLDDKDSLNYFDQTIHEYSRNSTYFENDSSEYLLGEPRSSKSDLPSTYILNSWKALFLRLQSWCIQRNKQGKLPAEITKYIFEKCKWENLESLLTSLLDATEHNLDDLLIWHKWDIEDESLLEQGGSFGGSGDLVAIGATLQGLLLLVDIPQQEIQNQKRLIKDDSYFNLLISENGAIVNFLTRIENEADKYIFLFGDRINNVETLKQNATKFLTYLGLTRNENAQAHRTTIINATLNQTKISSFKTKLLQGYNEATRIRKILKRKNKVILELATKSKHSLGINTLFDKEAFIGTTSVDYTGLAEEYGKQLASVEDYKIVESIFSNPKATITKVFNASDAKVKLDAYIANISTGDISNTIIFILDSFSLQEAITRSEDFVWSTEHPKTYIGKYKGVKLYNSRIGTEKGLVVFNIASSITVKQLAPDVLEGEMVGTDNHISSLFKSLSNKEMEDIHNKSHQPIEELKQKVWLRFLVCIGVEIDSKDKILKVGIKSEEEI